MKILVLVKQTYDTEEKIVIRNKKVVEEGVELVVNPYDEYAIEEAIKIKEQYGGEVTLISVGSEEVETALRTGLAMGADKGILINSEKEDLDEYSTCKVLSHIIKQQDYDIILCGNVAVDNGASQIGPRLAEELNIVQISSVVKVEIDEEKVILERDVEGDIEVIETSLPVLLSAQQGLNEPRYPSLPGVMKAKKKPLEKIDLASLSIEIDISKRTDIIEQFLPPQKQGGYMLEGDTSHQIKELVNLLSSKEKII